MSELGEQYPAETEFSEALRNVMSEKDVESLIKHMQAINPDLTYGQAAELAGQTLIDESAGAFPAESEDIYQILRSAIDKQ